MLLSKSCKYGLRASVLLATMDRDSYVSIRDLSSELNISFHFLTKIFQKMNAAELLNSKKGVNGGVKLSIPSSRITFMDIVVAIDGTCSLDSCALGLPGCGEKRPCPMHEQWSAIKTDMIKTMQTLTIAELAGMPVDDWKNLLVYGKNEDLPLNADQKTRNVK